MCLPLFVTWSGKAVRDAKNTATDWRHLLELWESWVDAAARANRQHYPDFIRLQNKLAKAAGATEYQALRQFYPAYF